MWKSSWWIHKIGRHNRTWDVHINKTPNVFFYLSPIQIRARFFQRFSPLTKRLSNSDVLTSTLAILKRSQWKYRTLKTINDHIRIFISPTQSLIEGLGGFHVERLTALQCRAVQASCTYNGTKEPIIRPWETHPIDHIWPLIMICEKCFDLGSKKTYFSNSPWQVQL